MGLAVLAISLGAMLTGCAAPLAARENRPVRTVVLGPSQSGQIVHLKEREKLVIRLPDAQAGFAWKISAPPNARVLRGMGQSAAPVRADWSTPRTVELSFQALVPGITTFELGYVPRAGGQAVQSFTLTVSVTMY